MQTKGRILLVDDDQSICNILDIILKGEGYEIVTVTKASEALDKFKDAYLQKPFDIVIQDIRMPEINGLELIKQFQAIDPLVIVLIITAFSDYQTATDAMREGAYDYIKKPFDNEVDLKPTIERAMHFRRLRQEFKEFPTVSDSLKIIGSTPQMKEIYSLIRRIAPTDSTVLIQGESGTGKELIARSIHYQSTRFSEQFLSVNCGAFAENLLESELFGHTKGSFTNAFSDKKGLLEVADNGTFFLDEVSELSSALQVKLLRAIEAREFLAVGSTKPKKVNVRFIAATNSDLHEQVKKNNFREDLFYRLNVFLIHLPPLRERRDDIPLLAGYFLAKYNKLMKKTISEFSDEVIDFLFNYNWPGNIRELENVIQRGVALAREDIINLEDLKHKQRLLTEKQVYAPAVEDKIVEESFIALPPNGINLEKKVEGIEIEYIRRALEQAKWNQVSAAKLLGLNTRTLRYKMKKYKLH